MPQTGIIKALHQAHRSSPLLLSYVPSNQLPLPACCWIVRYTMTPKPRKRPLSLTLSSIELLQQEAAGGAVHHRTPSATPETSGQSAVIGAAIDPPHPSSSIATLSQSARPTNSFYRSVEAQLQILGPSHVGFSSLSVPEYPISVVGARPFAKGGNPDSVAAFYDYICGISTETEFANRIVKEAIAASTAPSPSLDPGLAEQPREIISQQGQGSSDRALVLLAHNGPFGLGAEAHNICGVDWRPERGDHGDKDLQGAIQRLHESGVSLPLVCFGHMHHVLYGGKALRQMVHVDAVHDTVYLNAATVPRVRRRASLDGSSSSGSGSGSGGKSRRKVKSRPVLPYQQGRDGVGKLPSQPHFMVVEFNDDVRVETAQDVWVDVEESSQQGAGPDSGCQMPPHSSFACKVRHQCQVLQRA